MDFGRWKGIVYFFIIVILTVASIFIIYDYKNGTFRVKLGLDLRSGSHIAVQLVPVVDPDTGQLRPITEETAERARGVFEKRLNPTGTKEVILQKEGNDRIIIEIPEETNIKRAEELIKKTGRLEFQEQSYDQVRKQAVWRTVMDGSAIADTDVIFGAGGTANPEVEFVLTKEGAKKFAEITERNVGKPIAIVFDKQMISSPVVKEPITGGRGTISGGDMTLDSATDLSLYLRAGALPTDVKILESMTVSPTLGAESLKMSLWAGFIGLGLVIIFMIWYYRVPGILADAALIFYTIVVLASMVLGKFVLSLPGIAGFILSIGMAVDANVLIFERIKEELWSGKSIRSAVETGFKRAFSSIFDSHVTTLIGAGVIYQFGSSSVKGFGLTLILGTILSLITAVFVTRVLVDLLVSTNLITSKKLYGE